MGGTIIVPRDGKGDFTSGGGGGVQRTPIPVFTIDSKKKKLI